MYVSLRRLDWHKERVLDEMYEDVSVKYSQQENLIFATDSGICLVSERHTHIF